MSRFGHLDAPNAAEDPVRDCLLVCVQVVLEKCINWKRTGVCGGFDGDDGELVKVNLSAIYRRKREDMVGLFNFFFAVVRVDLPSTSRIEQQSITGCIVFVRWRLEKRAIGLSLNVRRRASPRTEGIFGSLTGENVRDPYVELDATTVWTRIPCACTK